MPRKISLSDLQLVAMAHAAARDDGQLLPLPASIANDERTASELGKLLKRKLIAETTVKHAVQQWRTDGDERVGLALTNAGRAAIGVDDGQRLVGADSELAGVEAPSPAVPAASSAAPAAAVTTLTSTPPRASKREAVLTLLRQNGGASLAELCEATGWLPHSARAFLTGLRKQGFAIERSRVEDVTRYAVVEAAHGQG